jgi:hypothetical protein
MHTMNSSNSNSNNNVNSRRNLYSNVYNAYSTNPYNTRKKVVSKPLIVAAFVIIVGTWLIVTLHLFSGSSNSSSSAAVDNASVHAAVLLKQQLLEEADHPVVVAAAAAGVKVLESITVLDDNNNNNNNNINKKKADTKKKKKKKDTNDYRTIKLEIPPPKSHKGDLDLDDQILNLTRTNPVYIGREKLIRMLLEMYIDVTQIDDDIWAQVPVWDDITKVHGKEPIIHGLTEDNCASFRDAVPEVDRHVAIAGMFNTGTNLLSILLQHNCAMPAGVAKLGRKKGHGMEWQVPWGKHTPVWYRKAAHVKNFLGKIPEDNIMVAVMVRHPHDWMSSMCRHGYTAKWNRTAKNCPNLFEGNRVTAKFGPGPSSHDSLAHMWNDWNGVYHNATTFKRLMVRFEDTIFFPKETSRKVCTCVGGKLMTPKEKDGIFHYVIDSAKTGPGHGPGQKRNGLIDAWIKYGKARKTKLSRSDLEFSELHLNRDIMRDLHWEFPVMPSSR